MTKIFFRVLRLSLMPFMLLWAKFGMPNGIARPPEKQTETDLACKKLVLYHFKTCPFCIKVRHEMARLSLPIQLRDAQHDPEHGAALLNGGGKIQTPCLMIEDDQANIQWLYESNDIVKYLQQRFS